MPKKSTLIFTRQHFGSLDLQPKERKYGDEENPHQHLAWTVIVGRHDGRRP